MNHHHHHLFWKRPFLPRSVRTRRLPWYEVSPHIPEHGPSRLQDKPSHFMSSVTHSLQVFLPIQTLYTPATSTFLQADAQSSPLLCSRCPNHLNLPRFTTSATLSIVPKRLYQPHFVFYPSTTFHTSISPSYPSVLSIHTQILQPSSSMFQSHMFNTLETNPYTSFTLCDKMRPITIELNFLNFLNLNWR